MRRGVILYGAPATGKDTITDALVQTGLFERFERMKCGPGRSAGYRLVSPEELALIQAMPGEVIWENDRYGATYVVDKTRLTHQLNSNRIPIVHLGQALAVDTLLAALPDVRWLIVELHCPRNIV